MVAQNKTCAVVLSVELIGESASLFQCITFYFHHLPPKKKKNLSSPLETELKISALAICVEGGRGRVVVHPPNVANVRPWMRCDIILLLLRGYI